MAVSAAVTRVACNTSTGTQDITITDFGTPKAALFICSYATADGTATSDYNISYGAATGASNEWCFSFNEADASANSDTYGTSDSDRCVRINQPATSGTVDGEAEFSAWITDGVRINWIDAPASAYLLTVILFGGSDLSAHANNVALGDTLDNATDVTAPGFEPNLVFTACFATHGMDAAATHNQPAFGLVHNSGAAVTQRSMSYRQSNGSSSGSPDGRCTASYGIMEVNTSGGLDWGGEFGSFDSSGFTVTTRNAGANNTSMGYLALGLGGAASGYVGTVSTPISTGDDSQTGPGFTPQLVFQIGTTMAAIDTAYNSNFVAGAFGLGAFDATSEYMTAVGNEDNAPTTDTQNLSDDTAVHLPEDDGTPGWVASFVSMDATGYTLNYSTVLGEADLFFIAAIEESDTSLTISVSDSISLSEAITASVDALAANQSESVTATDSPAAALAALALSVAEAISIAEALDAVLVHLVELSDAVSVNENRTAALNDLTLSVGEGVTVADTPAVVVVGAGQNVGVSDAVAVAETVSPVLAALSVNVSDSLSVAEALQTDIISLVGVSESASLSESQSVALSAALDVTVSDSITLTENADVTNVGVGTLYYVDPAATDDTGDGSIGDPWKYINTHVDELLAGDTMYLRGSTDPSSPTTHTPTAAIAPTVSGTASDPITIVNYPGEYVKIASPGILTDVFDFDHGTDYWTVSGTSEDYFIEIDREDETRRVFEIHGDNITVEYIEMHNAAWDQMIRIHGADSTTISHCKIYDNFEGPTLGSNGIQVVNGSTNWIIEYCNIYDVGGDCVQIGGDSPGSATEIDGIIRYCEMHTGVVRDRAGSENAIDNKTAKDVQIYGCTFHGFRDNDTSISGTGANGEAVVMQNDADGCDFYDNIIYDCSGGAFRADRPNVRVWGNLAYGMAAEDAATEVMWHFRNSHTYQFYNNTTHGTFGANQGDLFRYKGSVTINIYNNLFNDTSNAVDDIDGLATVNADYNGWFGSATRHYSGSNDVVDLDPGGDPSFRNEGSDDYRLAGGSGAIDQATEQAPYTDNFWGDNPDIGYWEFVPLEEISITESATVSIYFPAEGSESVSVSESTAASLAALTVTVSESVSITESVQVQVPVEGELNVNPSDVASVAENVALQTDALTAAITDNVSVSDTVARAIEALTVALSDAVGVTENASVAIEVAGAITVSVSDAVSITENVSVDLLCEVNASENVSVSEAVSTETETLTAALSETVTLTESLTVACISDEAYAITVADSSTVTDTPSTLTAGTAVSSTEAVSLGESVSVQTLPGSLAVNTSDAISITDTAALSVAAMLIVVSQGVTVTESITRNDGQTPIALTMTDRDLTLTVLDRDLTLTLPDV